jgi:hypothetical protein
MKSLERIESVVLSENVTFDAVPETINGLRKSLYDELNGLRTGTTTIQRAREVCRVASQVIDSVRVQVQYNKVILDAHKSTEKMSDLFESNN